MILPRGVKSALVREPESRIDEDLSERVQDRVWRVRIRGQPRFVLVLLEFQSTAADRTMALRMLDYTAGLYRDVLRESRARRLPTVLPIVLYHGKRPWRAREEVAELADPERAVEVGEWLLECESGEELLDRVEGLCESSAAGDGASPG